MIRQAEEADLPVILEIYAYARDFMAENGNPHQWAGGFPPASLLQDDIAKHNLYVVTEEETERVCGVFFFDIGPDETYSVIEQGEWFSDSVYGTIHRIAGDGTVHGLLRKVVSYCEKKTPHLRIDTHEDNHIMQHVIAQCGFRRCGIIHVSDGTPRIAYEKCEKEIGKQDCRQICNVQRVAI